MALEGGVRVKGVVAGHWVALVGRPAVKEPCVSCLLPPEPHSPVTGPLYDASDILWFKLLSVGV